MITSRKHRVERIVLVLTIMSWCGYANAQTTYYVNDICGNDFNFGTSSSCDPPNGFIKTIKRGIELTQNDGDVVVVTAGLYWGLIRLYRKEIKRMIAANVPYDTLFGD